MKTLRISILILIFSLITGCVGGTSLNPVSIPTAPTEVQVATPTVSIDIQVPTPTETPLPKPTQITWSTDPHPLQIEVNRQWTYPGSEITFEETLPSRPTYDQFVVSYLSEGYKIYAYMAIPNGTRPESGCRPSS